MLADLEELRALQERQKRALASGDAELLAELAARGEELARRLRPEAITDDAERAAVAEVASQVSRAQDDLEQMAARIRGTILEQIRALGPGREALAAYRPPARDTSRLVDRTH